MSKIIKVTESELRNMIKESVQNILKEAYETVQWQHFNNGPTDNQMFKDAVETIEMSDGQIDFDEWYPAFQDYINYDEAEEIWVKALKHCGYSGILYNESELKQSVTETVKKALREGQGLDYFKTTYDDISKDDEYTFSDFIEYLKNGSRDHRNFIQSGDAFLSSKQKNRVGDYYDPTNPLESWPGPTKGEKPMKKINKTLYGKIGRALGSAGSLGVAGGKSIYNSLRGKKK